MLKMYITAKVTCICMPRRLADVTVIDFDFVHHNSYSASNLKDLLLKIHPKRIIRCISVHVTGS